MAQFCEFAGLASRTFVLSRLIAVSVASLCPVLAEPASQIRLNFVILDNETSLPMKGARVCLSDPFCAAIEEADGSVAYTDVRGVASVSCDFHLGEIVNDVNDGKRINVLGWRVKVSAEGYQSSTAPLFEYTGKFIDTRTRNLECPSIKLRRGSTAAFNHGLNSQTFVYRKVWRRISIVFYENKFDALLSCPKLCSQHTPWFETKHGTVSRAEGLLQFSVRDQERIRRGAEAVQWLPNNLVRMKWDQRQYLIPADQGLAFCNAVNQGEEPRDSEYGDFALGEGQGALAVTDLPEVPRQWSRYLLTAPVQGKVTELLPGLRAKVDVGQLQGLCMGMELVPTEEYLFSDTEIIWVGERTSVISTKYPDGRYRKIRVGDIVSTRRPKSKIVIQKNL